MVQELLVVAARPLPFEGRPFELKLGSSEGIEVHQLIHPLDIDVGFSPRVVLSLVPANVKSHAVAAALASALDGVVYDETGATVPDAEVALIVDATRSLAAFSEGDVAATVVTKRDGAFWFDDPTAISVHERYLLRVRHPAYGVERATPIDPRDASKSAA